MGKRELEQYLVDEALSVYQGGTVVAGRILESGRSREIRINEARVQAAPVLAARCFAMGTIITINPDAAVSMPA